MKIYHASKQRCCPKVGSLASTICTLSSLRAVHQPPSFSGGPVLPVAFSTKSPHLYVSIIHSPDFFLFPKSHVRRPPSPFPRNPADQKRSTEGGTCGEPHCRTPLGAPLSTVITATATPEKATIIAVILFNAFTFFLFRLMKRP